jgi:hypothetical protein
MPTLQEIDLAAGQISEADPLIWQNNVGYAARTYLMHEALEKGTRSVPYTLLLEIRTLHRGAGKLQ